MKIYYAEICELTEEEQYQIMQLLPNVRIEKIQRMKSEKNRLLSMSAGLLLENALREQGLRGKELTFLKQKDGKPYIAEYPEFHYNLSHSKECVALVVDSYPVGIDVEALRIGYQKLAKRFFSETEVACLKDMWSDEVFTKIWTRKESYLKATGYGMRLPLDSFSTLYEQVEINEKMPEDMRTDGYVYYLASMPLESGYWISVCRLGLPVVNEQLELAIERVELKEILKRYR